MPRYTPSNRRPVDMRELLTQRETDVITHPQKLSKAQSLIFSSQAKIFKSKMVKNQLQIYNGFT